MVQTEQLLLSPSACAEALGVSRSTVYSLIAKGHLPAARLREGRLIRVPIAALKLIADEAINAKGSQK